MTNRARSNNLFWQQCYTAALTGLTVAGAIRMTESHDKPALEPGTALATMSDEDARLALRKMDYPSPAESAPGEAAIDPYHRALVEEAMKIADASCDIILGPVTEKPAGDVRLPDRPAPQAVGNVKVYKTS